MPLALGTYAPPALNPLLLPIADQPATDTDPASPTYGQPTYSNVRPPANAPAYDTTAKGNAGQPAPSVPTTADNSVSITAPGSFAPPSEGGPSKPATPPPSILRNLQPQVNEHGEPLGQPDTAKSAPDSILRNLQPQVDEHGEPAKAVDTGQYLSAPTSPGAKAIGTGLTWNRPQPTTIAEDQVPGMAFQSYINVATDPAQKARLAAQWLFPKDPNGLDRIIIGDGGRMAAVGPDGRPYYIEPQPMISSDAGITRGEPGTPWQPMGSFQTSAYGEPFKPIGDIHPWNIASSAGAAAPNALVSGLQLAPNLVGGPVLSSALVAPVTVATNAGRQWLANKMDPNPAAAPPVMTPDTLKAAGLDALSNLGMRYLGNKLTLGMREPLGAPDQPWLLDHPWSEQTQFPGREPQPMGPSMPITGPEPASAGVAPTPAAPGVQANPAGEAAATSGPYAPSTPEELKAQPTTLPPSWRPIAGQGGADSWADRVLRYFAAKGPTAVDTRTLVPGSSGTLAGRTGNAGVAALERLVRNMPEAANEFAAADAVDQAARRAFTAKLVGTPEEVSALEAQRDAATSAAREAAFANAKPTDPSEAVAEIDKILAGPDGKRPAVALPLRQVRGLFYTVDPETGATVLDTDPEMLYGVRKAITDALSPLSRGTERYAGAAAAQLQNVLAKLDTAIEAGAPGFKGYLAQFHAQSQPIDAMKFLQSRNLTDTAGDTTLQKVDSLLKDIQRQRTLQPGVRPADALSDEQIAQLNDLRDDLRRVANLGKGKALGSNTAQNLVGNQSLNMLTRPATQEIGKAIATTFGGLPGYLGAAGLERAASNWIGSRQDMVRQALIDRLLNRNGLGARALAPGAGEPPP